MPLPLLLAWRFLKGSHEKTITVMVRICFISILLGTGSLTLIAAIMNGFEQQTHKKLQGVHADITISAQGQALDYPQLAQHLRQHHADSIAAFAPTSMYHVMLEVPLDATTREQTVCLLKAIDPQQEPTVTGFDQFLTTDDTWQQLTTEGIALGAPLAERLNLTVGSTVTLLYYTQDGTTHKKKATVAGLFKTGINDIDQQMLLASFELVDSMYPHRVTHVSCKLANPQDESVIPTLQKELSLEVKSWKDLYLPLVSALTLEKYAMWIILLLVTLVASLTIISLLYMYTTHKRTDIALLASLGMPLSQIKQVFLWISVIITFCGTLTGMAIAALSCYLLKTYPFITLPDTYYVTHLPAELTGSIIGAVLAIALLISLCAGLFPNARLSTTGLSKLLKGMA